MNLAEIYKDLSALAITAQEETLDPSIVGKRVIRDGVAYKVSGIKFIDRQIALEDCEGPRTLQTPEIAARGVSPEREDRQISFDEFFDKLVIIEGGAGSISEGGAGSGHFGHEGRPGEVGGSVPSGSGGGESHGTAKSETARLISLASEHEPSLTAALKDVVQKSGGELRGLDVRLKSESSLSRKIESRMKENPGASAKEIAGTIKDAVRYTVVFDHTNYATGVQKTIAELKTAGFAPAELKNYWQAGDQYQGLNGVFKNALQFEIQFHTPGSFHVKETQSHPIYEKFRTTTDRKELANLNKQMIDIWKTVPAPPGVERIGTPTRLAA